MGRHAMNKPVFVRLQNTKQYSAYKKRNLNRKKTDPNTFLTTNAEDNNSVQNFFEPPVSKREWWRVYLHETPVPGTYEYQDFLQHSSKKPLYASFKAEGRGKKAEINSGGCLLPGAYEFTDFIENVRKRPCTFAFKSSGREKQLAWERLRSEEMAFPVPGQYETISPPVTPLTVASSAFKSKTSRFKHLFSARKGPPPGRYNPTNFTQVGLEKKQCKSSFISKAPRFKSSGTNVPGPGTYETDRYDRYLGLSIGQRRLI